MFWGCFYAVLGCFEVFLGGFGGVVGANLFSENVFEPGLRECKRAPRKVVGSGSTGVPDG